MNNDTHEAFVITAIKDDEVFYITDIDDDWLSRNVAEGQMITNEHAAKEILQSFKFDHDEFDSLSDFEIGYARVKIIVEVSA